MSPSCAPPPFDRVPRRPTDPRPRARCSRYTIFVAENLEAFISAVTDGKTSVDIKWLILAQLVVFLPLSLVRNLAKLSGTALVADAFILIGRESGSCRPSLEYMAS